MKYFVIGLHASGKQEVLDNLSKLGVNCGKKFSNIDKPSTNIYNSHNYELYTINDVNEVFENEAYVFIKELQSKHLLNTNKYFEGLSKYTFDQNDVFALSPDQFISISPINVNDEVCFVWLDNTKSYRKNKYYNDKCSYNFNEREEIEKRDMNEFVKSIYNFPNSHMIYFNNEEPERIATIIYTLIKHPELFKLYKKTFA